MLNQIIANQLLEDIVDAYRYKDREILKRKLKKAMEKVDGGKPGRKGRPKSWKYVHIARLRYWY